MNPILDSVKPGSRLRRRAAVVATRAGVRPLLARTLVFAASLGVVLLVAFAPNEAARAADEPQPRLPTVEVRVGGVPLTVEIASGGEQRYMGLSFRESLAENAGMLFVYPSARPLTFTMRNTLLPLSIAFIDDGLVVREIVDMDVGPNQLFDSAAPARYALEVNQGWFERNGVEPGAAVTMP